MKTSKTGYKRNSKDKNEPILKIPSNHITMKGVDFPVLGISQGHMQMMYPGMDYLFPGNHVYEIPMAQDGLQKEKDDLYERPALDQVTVYSEKPSWVKDRESKSPDNLSWYETLNFKKWGLNDYSNYSSFNSAFRNARESGEKEFVWNDKRYNTNLVPKETSDKYWDAKKFLQDYYTNENFTPLDTTSTALYDFYDDYTKKKYGYTWLDYYDKIKNTPQYLDPKSDEDLNTYDKYQDTLRLLDTPNFYSEYSDEAKAAFKDRAKNKYIEALNDPNYYFSITSKPDPKNPTLGYVDNRNNQSKIYVSDTGNLNDFTTFVHELSHKGDSKSRIDYYRNNGRIPEIDTDKLNEHGSKLTQERFDYVSDPSETEARKMSTLYFMNRVLNKDIKSGKITKNDLDELYNTYISEGGYGKGKSVPSDVQDLLELYKWQNDDLLKYLNNDFSYKKVSKKYGGDPSIPDLSNRGWLSKYQPGGGTRIYTDREEFAKANRAYNDSLDVYNAPAEAYKRSIEIDNAINSGNFQRAQDLLDKPHTFTGAWNRLTRLNNENPQPVSGYGIYLGINPSDPLVPKFKEPTTLPVYQPEPKAKPIVTKSGTLPITDDKGLMPSKKLQIQEGILPVRETYYAHFDPAHPNAGRVINYYDPGKKEYVKEPTYELKENGGWLSKYQDGGIVKLGTKYEIQRTKDSYQLRKTGTENWADLTEDDVNYFKDLFPDKFSDSNPVWNVEKVMKQAPAPTPKPKVTKTPSVGPVNPAMADIAPTAYSAITGVDLPKAKEVKENVEVEKFSKSPYFNVTPYNTPETAIKEYEKTPDYSLRYKADNEYSPDELRGIQNHLVNTGYISAPEKIDPGKYTTEEDILGLQKFLVGEGMSDKFLSKNVNKLSGKLDKATLEAIDQYNRNRLPFKEGELDDTTKAAINKYKEQADISNTVDVKILDPSEFEGDPDASSTILTDFQNRLNAKGFFTGDYDFKFEPKSPGEAKVAYNFKLNSDPTTPFAFCAQYVTGQAEKEDVAGLQAREELGLTGDAWTMPDNIIKKGGKLVFNGLEQRKLTDYKTKEDLEYGIKGRLSDPELRQDLQNLIGSGNIYSKENAPKVKPGDIVNIFYEGSDFAQTAYNQAAPNNNSLYTTHVGIVKADEQGNLYVEHNIHHSVQKNSLQDFLDGKVQGNGKDKVSLISGVTRPNYFSGVDWNGTIPVSGMPYYQTEQGKLNPKGALANPEDWGMQTIGGETTYKLLSTIENNKEALLKDIPVSEREFNQLMRAARVLPTTETSGGKNLKGWSLSGEDIAKEIGDAVGFGERSRGLTNIKDEQNFSPELRQKLYGDDDSQLEDPTKAALPTFYALSSRYLYLKEFANKNKISVTADQLAKLSLMGYTHSINNVANDLRKAGSYDKYVQGQQKAAQDRGKETFQGSNMLDLFDKQTMKKGGSVSWLKKYQDGNQVPSKYDLMRIDQPTAVAESTRVVVPNIVNAPKQAPAVKQEAQRLTEKKKELKAKYPKIPIETNRQVYDMEEFDNNQAPANFSKRVSIPGVSGSMVSGFMDPNTGEQWVAPSKQAAQQASSEIASGNNVDPIGLGILAATGAGPLIRTAGAALPYLDAPAVLPYVGEVPWLTANNVMNAGFAANSINQIVNPNSDLRNNPNAVNIAETALGLLPFVGPAAKLATEATNATGKYLNNKYLDIAEGANPFEYAWRSPAARFDDAAVALDEMEDVLMPLSQQHFDDIRSRLNLTDEERKILKDYEYDSRSFTGRGSETIDKNKRAVLDNILKRAEIETSNPLVISRRVDASNPELFKTIDNKIVFERPTSWSAGRDALGNNVRAERSPDRIVAKLPSGKNKVLKNPYETLTDAQLEEYKQSLRAKGYSEDNVETYAKMFNTPRVSERELLLGADAQFKQIGKVKNKIGGYDYIVKPINTSKLPPSSGNIDELVDLWRIQERGARPMSELAAEGKLGPMFQNEKAIQHFKDREKYFGQWFTKDKADFDFYKADREFVDPEIIQLQVPKSKLAEFQNYDKSLSRAADREFVIPLEQQKLFAASSQKKYGGWLSNHQDGGPENNPYETQQLANNTRESLQSEYARIARMQQDALDSMQSHEESFDNKPFCTVLPNGQSYCATRATEVLRKSGYPVKQIASSRVLKEQLTPEKGWYPTDYNNLQPADIALAERPGHWHTMLSTGNASNVHPFFTQDIPSIQQKGFFWDSGDGNSWGFQSPANEQELAKWIDPKAMKYYTYQGNIPGLESQYNDYLNKVKENPAPKMQSRPASRLKKGGWLKNYM